MLFDASHYFVNPFGHHYDVSPDGQRFVMIRGDSGTSVQIAVVFNFVEELKRTMDAQ